MFSVLAWCTISTLLFYCCRRICPWEIVSRGCIALCPVYYVCEGAHAWCYDDSNVFMMKFKCTGKRQRTKTNTSYKPMSCLFCYLNISSVCVYLLSYLDVCMSLYWWWKNVYVGATALILNIYECSALVSRINTMFVHVLE